MNDNRKETIEFWSQFLSSKKPAFSKKVIDTARLVFRITDDETLFALYKITSDDGRDYIAVTDIAIYFSDIRWHLDNICKFTISDDNGTCYIDRDNGVFYKLYSGEAKPLEKGGSDFPALVRAMQKHSYDNNAHSRQCRQRLLGYVQKKANDELSSQYTFSTHVWRILKELLCESDFKIQAANTLIQNEILNCDYNGIVNDSLILSEAISPNRMTSWMRSYARKILTDEEATKHVQTKYASTPKIPFQNTADNLHEFYDEIAHLYQSLNLRNLISNFAIKSIDDLINYTGAISISSEELTRLIYYRNDLNQQAFDDLKEIISSGSAYNRDGIIEVEDGYGLTGLSYAIIYNNATLIKQYIDTHPLFDATREEIPVLSLLFLSSYIHRDKIFKILIETTSEWKSLSKTLSSAKKSLNRLTLSARNASRLAENSHRSKGSALNGKIQTQRALILRLQKEINAGKGYKKSQLKEEKLRLEKLLIERENHFQSDDKTFADKMVDRISSNIKELQSEISGIETELSSLFTVYEEKYAALSHTFATDTEPIIQILLYIYSHSGKRKYTEPKDLILVKVFNKTFVINKSWYEECQAKDFQRKAAARKQKENDGAQKSDSKSKKKKLSDVTKPYGENWFSPEAYTDIAVMKREYRKLAAKYHPDNAEYDSEVFVSIQAEKSAIMDALKD